MRQHKNKILRGRICFLIIKKSKEKEAELLKGFLRCLDDINSYLDEYDEMIGLAFNKDEPTRSCEKLIHFLSERRYELIKD